MDLCQIPHRNTDRDLEMKSLHNLFVLDPILGPTVVLGPMAVPASRDVGIRGLRHIRDVDDDDVDGDGLGGKACGVHILRLNNEGIPYRRDIRDDVDDGPYHHHNDRVAHIHNRCHNSLVVSFHVGNFHFADYIHLTFHSLLLNLVPYSICVYIKKELIRLKVGRWLK